MFILHGIYHFKPKIMAYRNDFCLSCVAPRRAYQIRSFDVLHLFYIPILPLGFVRHWRCSACQNPPHVSSNIRRWFKWAGTIVLGSFAAAMWAPGAVEDGSAALGWALRIILSTAFIVALWWAIRSKPDIKLKEKLKEVSPAQDNLCPLCGGVFIVDSQFRCANCGVMRTALPT